MRLRRAVLQIPVKSSVSRELPFYKDRSLLDPSQSTLPQLLIPLHFNSFRSNTYRKPWGEGPAANPKVCQLVIRRAQLLRMHSNSRNSSAFIELLTTLNIPRGGWGTSFPPRRYLSLSALYLPISPLPRALGGLCVEIPIPTRLDLLRYTQADPRASSLSLFTTHYPLLTLSPSFHGKIYPPLSRSHHV